MTRALALLRPEPGWTTSACAARAAGIAVVGHPLFVAEPVAWHPPEGNFDGLLIGSGTALRCGGPQLGELLNLPAFAVGEATAAAARAAGFAVAETGSGGLQALLDNLAGRAHRFLRLAGEERVPLTPHPGHIITDCVVYRMVPQAIDAGFATALGDRPLVGLHSAAAAAHFGREIDRLGIARGTLALLALGERIAAAAGPGWARTDIAAAPNESAMLAKAAALCK